MNDELQDDLVFWEQVRNDGRRTILCAPERVDYVRGIVARRDPLGQFTVKPSNAVTGNMLIVVDEQAFEAYSNEQMLRALREPMFPSATRISYDGVNIKLRIRTEMSVAARAQDPTRLVVTGDCSPAVAPARPAEESAEPGPSWAKRAIARLANLFRSTWWRRQR